MTYRHVVVIHGDFISLDPNRPGRSVNFSAETVGDEDAIALGRWFEDNIRRSFDPAKGVHDPLPEYREPELSHVTIVNGKTGERRPITVTPGAMVRLTKDEYLQWDEA